MFTQNIIAASALLSIVAAVPLNNNNNHEQKRDIVWVTQTQEDIVTMEMTKTVWLEPGETPPTPGSHFGHHHHHSKVTSHILSTVTVPAPSSPVAPVESSSSSSSSYVAPAPYSAPSSSSSVYVAPTTSSTSVYVAPTTSSSSVYVAPTTSSTSVYVAPSSTYVAPSSTSAYTPPAPSASSYGGGSALTGMAAPGTSYTGDLTYYADGLGACGITSTPDQSIVAVSEVIFDSYNTGNPNDNPICGKTVTITNGSGEQFKATVVDRCVGCNQNSLDLSSGFFQNFAELAVGRLTDVDWCFD